MGKLKKQEENQMWQITSGFEKERQKESSENAGALFLSAVFLWRNF
jgi:hypothetical protein